MRTAYVSISIPEDVSDEEFLDFLKDHTQLESYLIQDDGGRPYQDYLQKMLINSNPVEE